MDLGKINRDSEDRSVVWASVSACVIAAVSLIGGALGLAAGDGGAAPILSLAIGCMQLILAWRIYRGSRAACIAVLALWIVDRLALIAVVGLAGLFNIWTIVLTALLVAGLRGVYAQHRRGSGMASRS